MAMSDCIKCWNTPCTCGWDYRHSSLEYLNMFRNKINKIIEFKVNNPDAQYSYYCADAETTDDKRYMDFITQEEA